MYSKFQFSLLIFAIAATAFANAQPKLYHTGAVEDVNTKPEFGALLMGGGTEPDDGVEWLLQKADGGDVVVLRASGSDGYNEYFYREIGGVNSVRTFVFSSREESFDDAMLDALENAELVFLAGGDQAKYLRFWKGTPVQTLINKHLAAGRPIGGTSAGLAVLGDTIYAAYKDSILSSTALKDPFSEDLTLETGFLKVPYLDHVITDSHFGERGRAGRLVAFQARAIAFRDKPIFGIGVDEETALAIDAGGKATVFSRKSTGRVYLIFFSSETAPQLISGEPLETGPFSMVGLGRRSSFDFVDSEVSAPEVFSVLRARSGKLVEVEEKAYK